MVDLRATDTVRLTHFLEMMNMPTEEIVVEGKVVSAYKTSFSYSVEEFGLIKTFKPGDYLVYDGTSLYGVRKSDLPGELSTPCPGCGNTLTKTLSDDKEIDGVLMRRFYTECTVCGFRTKYVFSSDAAKMLWAKRI